MKRTGLRIVAIIFTAGLMFFPLVAATTGPDEASTTADPVDVTAYKADFLVLASGRLVAKETLTADFPPGRHGIFRFWDLEDPSDPHARLDPDGIRITLDGQEVPFEMSWQLARRLRVAKIGDPDSTLFPGSHVYTISYQIDGAVSPGSANDKRFASSRPGNATTSPSVFSWNVVAPGWQLDMARTTARIQLPAASGRVQCTSSRDGTKPCTISGAGTDVVTVGTKALPPRTPVTVRVGLPIRTPDRVTVPWSINYDGVLGRNLPVLIAVLVISVAALLLGYLLDRRSREEEPGLPVTYGPPAGLGPVQTAFVIDEVVPQRALVATLLYQAEQGLTTLDRADGDDWTIHGRGSDQEWAETDDVTRHIGQTLGVATKDGAFTAGSSVGSGETLQLAQSAVGSAVRSWADGIGAQQRVSSETRGRIGVYTAIVLAVLVGLASPAAVYGLPFAAFVIGGIGLLLKGVGTRRTTLGRQLWSESGGFKRMLSTPSAKARFDFSGRKDLYTAFIPYAVVFDCADQWAEKYEVETGSAAPVPAWYAGGVVGSSGAFGSSDSSDSFESSLASSISAYTATQSSSSSSGGGGGGGGGGGSW